MLMASPSSAAIGPAGSRTVREKFGDWPQGGITPIKPSPEVLSWVRSRNIAWAKSSQRAAQ